MTLQPGYPAFVAALMVLMPTAFLDQDKPTRTTPRSLRCTPAVVAHGDTLELRFTDSHGGELGVWTPEGRFLFIAFEQEDPDTVPPIPSVRFKSTRSVRLEVKTVKGVESPTRGHSQTVFKEVGRYWFIASENLETEDDTGANRVCTVTFR